MIAVRMILHQHHSASSGTALRVLDSGKNGERLAQRPNIARTIALCACHINKGSPAFTF